MTNFIRTSVLFSLTVFAVALLYTVNILILGGGSWINLNFLEYSQFLVFLTLFVIIGALISLLLSKYIAKIFLKVRVVEIPETVNELRLFSTVKRLSDAVSIRMPDIMIYQGYDINAFATGFRRDYALLAVSQQLLDVMTQDEMEGVVGHEISHIANGDMLTLALMQGVVNSIVYLPANSIKFILGKIFTTQKFYHIMFYYLIVSATQLSFGWIASLLVMWFSRRREFHADLCGARIAGHESMLRALECLQACKVSEVSPNLAINYDNLSRSALYQLFISHPSLSARITALRNLS
ncbi:MAG: protease HtpX [Thiohalomonadales bacterium]